MFYNCALGGRLLYGTNLYFITTSAFLIGYRQVCLAHTIHNIVKSGDLIAEKFRKRTDKIFAFFLIGISIYFILFLIATVIVNDDMQVIPLIITLNVANDVIILTALVLYSFTIILLRLAIANCASFQFETGGTYFIIALYTMSLLV